MGGEAPGVSGTALVVVVEKRQVGKKPTMYSDFADLGVDMILHQGRGYKRLKDGKRVVKRRTIYERYTDEELWDMAHKGFKVRVKQTHPDLGGDFEEFLSVCNAYHHIRKVLMFRSIRLYTRESYGI